MQTFLSIPLTTLVMTAQPVWTGNEAFNSSAISDICLSENTEVQNDPLNSTFYVPDVIVKVENIEGEEATVEQLTRASKMVVSYPDNFNAEKTAAVESFTLSYFRDGAWIDIHTTGAEITPEMHDVLKDLKPSEKIYFERILVKMPDGCSSRKIVSQAIRVI